MNGAESLVRTLVASGVDVCFANPGTSEMHFVAALDHVEGMRPVLALFEGVATGAADGYARMAGKPAATLLHLGAGLANGGANLHNARRAQVPLLNIVGDHATDHLKYDAPLTSDVVGIARPFSAWVHRSVSAGQVAHDAARAVRATMEPPGQIATLILPADTAWNPADQVAVPLPKIQPAKVDEETVGRIAEALKSGGKTAILMRGKALEREGLEVAGRIAAASGCRLMCDTFAPRLDRGAGVVAVERIPYFAEQMLEFLAGLDQLVIVGTRPPVTFFAYPDKPSWCLPETCRVLYLAHEHEDGVGALHALADRMGAKAPAAGVALARPERPAGKWNVYAIGQAVGALLPEGAIICDDGATSSGPVVASTAAAPPHTHLALTGGAIGSGLPLAVGAAVASPDRKVLCITGDGSAMYTPQALWTMARENLDVTVLVFANHSYKILNVELGRVGAGAGGPKAQAMLDLRRPELDFVALGRSMGVEATRAETIEAFYDQFADAMNTRGPRLIEAMI